jgi:hypothetical protein
MVQIGQSIELRPPNRRDLVVVAGVGPVRAPCAATPSRSAAMSR